MQRRSFMRYFGALLLVGATSTLPTVSARMGRPMSPGSMAGVHRRHRRRRRRRIAVGMTLTTLPNGCSARTRDGIDYQYCDGVWYQPSYQGTEVVYVVNDMDAGTEAYTDE